MIRASDVNQIELVNRLAEEMKKEKLLQPPEWSKFVKTGSSKDRVPSQEDWWYLRGASILRRMYLDNRPVGVNRLRRVYGDTEKNRYSGKHFKPAGGAIIRKLLQQLEKSGLITKVKIQNRPGRRISPKGISLADMTAKNTSK
ncbi:MAG: 30S ribosomal protein S19e [Candidatus Parvarchaeota archaeon]|nr:30S ribosomal protein S19e [Candidatus Parvarchaeota archaeon]